jgi:hypothetical protein
LDVFGAPLIKQSDLHAHVASVLTDVGRTVEAQRPAREAFVADHLAHLDGRAGERAVTALMELR